MNHCAIFSEGRMGAYDSVPRSLSLLRERISAAASRAGRDSAEVSIMAVTKFHPREAIEAAWVSGIRRFGENRVQEAEAKYPEFLIAHPGAELEMIGHLQSNKAGKAVRIFSRIQSVDSIELLRELGRRAASEGRRLRFLFELHTGEESKAGFLSSEELYRACDIVSRLDFLAPCGIMTMAPFTSNESLIRVSFRSAREAFEGVKSRFGFRTFDELSMGMSGDFEIAVEEGSTLLRIGTALFGARAE